jgi:hypothetical protein
VILITGFPRFFSADFLTEIRTAALRIIGLKTADLPATTAAKSITGPQMRNY